jgi:hypothetical protein
MKKMSIVRGACITMIFIGLLNMAVFLAIDLRLGGDALNGKASSGHYCIYGFNLRLDRKGIRKSAKPPLDIASGTATVLLLHGV